jgi:regulator of sigma E protease
LGITLIAVTLSWNFLWIILEVSVGLGAVIFVHELGHFLVAKACGVNCEKFFIGFDIGGIKLSRKWGETEYGIGILPLGGYVKMLGQDDNPAKIAEEMERARVRTEDQADDGTPGDDQYQLDPGSYLAKSVPQRMAIISAGVVMNVIFAFIFAMVAYGMGVKYLPCIISEVVPGSPAWQADLQVGDKIVRIGDVDKPRFRDLQSDISLGDPTRGVPIEVRRAGVGTALSFTIHPDRSSGLPTIGVVSPRSLTLFADNPTVPGSPAAQCDPPLAGGDRITAIDGQPITTYRELVCHLAAQREKPVELTVLRDQKPRGADGTRGSAATDITVRIAPNPVKCLGLIMQYGPIQAIQADSPAAVAGVKPGDTIRAIDGQDPGDPLTLAQRLRRRASSGGSVRLTLARPGADDATESLELEVPLRSRCAFEPADRLGAPVAISSLGIAYDVISRVQAVVPDSPAAQQDIVAGDAIVQAQFIAAPNDTSVQAKLLTDSPPIALDKEQPNWPAMMELLQALPPGATIRLTVQSTSTASREVNLTPVDSAEWFNPDRGLVTGPLEEIRKAGSLGEAFVLGARETQDALLMVYRFLKRLIDRQISPRMMGGPVTIARVAGHSASAGLATLLIFLTMLSANLAVINFLPIPLLDGGHMVLLIVEGILRRPVSEKIVVALHTIGFVFIISLMLFVLALDVGLIPRGL